MGLQSWEPPCWTKTASYGVPFGTGNRWPKMCMQGSQVQPLWVSITVIVPNATVALPHVK